MTGESAVIIAFLERVHKLAADKPIWMISKDSRKRLLFVPNTPLARGQSPKILIEQSVMDFLKQPKDFVLFKKMNE